MGCMKGMEATMKQPLKVIILVLLLSVVTVTAQQDVNTVVVVATCGTPPSNFPSSGRTFVTIDTSGRICTDSASDLSAMAADLEEIKNNTGSTDPVGVLPKATSTGGSSACHQITTASTNAKSCATAAAALYGIRAINTTTTIAYLRPYNLASAPTCNSATGEITDGAIPIPPAAASGGAGGFVEPLTIGLTGPFSTGIGWCVTGGGGSADNTNAPAGIYIQVRFKQ
jgi:hypothetical protein